MAMPAMVREDTGGGVGMEVMLAVGTIGDIVGGGTVDV